MITIGSLVRLVTKPGNAHGHLGSVRVGAPKEHAQNHRTCRQHGTLPGSWQLARDHPRPFCMACSSQSDTSPTPSAISSIAMVCRNDWHSRCTSMCRGNACKVPGTSHHCMFPPVVVTLLGAVFGCDPATRAQNAPTASGAQGQT